MRGHLQSQPAISHCQLERGHANAFHTEQGQLRFSGICRLAEVGRCFSGFAVAYQSCDGEQSCRTEKAAEIAWYKRSRDIGEVTVARPRKSFAGVEGRCGRVSAGKAAAGNNKPPVAGDPLIRVPAPCRNQAVQNQRLERGSGAANVWAASLSRCDPSRRPDARSTTTIRAPGVERAAWSKAVCQLRGGVGLPAAVSAPNTAAVAIDRTIPCTGKV